MADLYRSNDDNSSLACHSNSTIIPGISRSYKARAFLSPEKQSTSKKRKRNKPSLFQVRSCGDSKHGIGMFATQRISRGDLIIAHEAPIVSSFLFPSSNRFYCMSCATPIGSLGRDHLLVKGDDDKGERDYDDLIFTSNHQTCHVCKQTSWCSELCYDRGWWQHSFFSCSCCSSEREVQAWKNFLARQETPVIFQLALEGILLILKELQNNSNTLVASATLYWWKDYGSHPLWWDLGSVDKRRTRKQETEEFCNIVVNLLKKKSQDNISVLEVCTLSNFGEILGMLQSNVMEFQYPNPTFQYWEHVQDFIEEEREKENSSCPNKGKYAYEVQDFIEKEEEQDSSTFTEPPPPPTILGSGLYPLLTLANHDCAPNAAIEFLQENNLGSMVALHDIEPEEEICITYVPNGGFGSTTESHGDYFRYFEATRTWKWLNAVHENDGCEEYETGHPETNSNGESATSEHNDDEVSMESKDTDDRKESPEGADPRERHKALLDYGFECQCRRCLEENTVISAQDTLNNDETKDD